LQTVLSEQDRTVLFVNKKNQKNFQGCLRILTLSRDSIRLVSLGVIFFAGAIRFQITTRARQKSVTPNQYEEPCNPNGFKVRSTFGSSLGPFLSRKGQYPPAQKPIAHYAEAVARKTKVKRTVSAYFSKYR
jgi:hypothetical protein